MQNVIRTLNPDKKFSGANDVRAGTTWVAEMYYHTEGHPDVARYLWFKKYTSPRVWNEITSGMTPPSRCYLSYERQVKKIVKRFKTTFDTDEHLHRTEFKFNNCVQGHGSVYEFIERLEDLSTELYHMGSPILEYKLKWKLYNGLSSEDLRVRVNDFLDDKRVGFAEFKEAVLRQQRRMTALRDFSKELDREDLRRGDADGRQNRRQTLPGSSVIVAYNVVMLLESA
ncbi:hypothetical protein FOZ63_001290 [Perkinsus olseni]|uniref:Retrotransposon gag domain-containing protein n=1 Tax=Perkinsus olseni TaxID=32597 RepID=A0A7J6RBE5_PEROL|nr:hypothetical protein FOZ63_001290 [Perkinsus olseni]